MKQISINQGYEKIILPFPDRVFYACWSSGEGEIAAGGDGDCIAIWTLPQTQPRLLLTTPKRESFSLRQLFWNRDSTKLLGYGVLVGWHIWDTYTGEILCSPGRPVSKQVFSACWDSDLKRVLAAHRNSVCIWDSATGERLLRISTYESMTALWSNDKSVIFVSGYDTPRTYNAKTGKQLFELEVESSECVVRLEPNTRGNMLLATSTEHKDWDLGPPCLWDAKTGRKILTLPKVGRSAAWGPDDTKILLYSSKPIADVFQLSLFDLDTQRITQTFDHTEMIFRAFFNNAGTRIISYGDNVRIFDVESGDPLRTIQSFAYVRYACLNVDETLLLTAGDDHAVRIWDLHRIMG